MNQKSDKINLMFSIGGLHHGGAERVIESMCKHLNPERYSISICWRVARGHIGEELKAIGFDVIGLPELDPNVTPYRRFRVLKKLLKDARIDIIHTHDRGALADAVQCRLMGAKAKIVHTFHFGNYPHLKKRYLLMDMVFSRFAHRLVAVGYEQAKSIQRALHLDETRLSTLYNGVEQASTESESDLVSVYRNASRDPVIIGSISTLTNQKGLFVLLDAASILRDKGANFVFVIAGDGPLRAELENRVQQLDLGKFVHFLGWVPNAAKELLHSLDVFCQSSLWEANSIVLLEAMSVGLAIVTTDVGESKHVIEQKVCGLIAEPGRPDSLAEALEELVNDRHKREVMGRLARSKFEKEYTVDNMARNYEAVYEEMLI